MVTIAKIRLYQVRLSNIKGNSIKGSLVKVLKGIRSHLNQIKWVPPNKHL